MIRQNMKELSQTVRAKNLLTNFIYSAIGTASHKPTLDPFKQYENNLSKIKNNLKKEVVPLKKEKQWLEKTKGQENKTNDYDKIIELLSDSEFVDEYAKRYYQKPKKEDNILYKTLYNRDDIGFYPEFQDFYIKITQKPNKNLGTTEYTVKPRYPKLFDFPEATFDSEARASIHTMGLYDDFQSGKNDKSYLDIEAIEKIVKRNFKDD